MSRAHQLLVAIVGATLLFLAAIATWYLTLIANVAVSPSIPWFVAADLLALYACLRYLRSQAVLARPFALRPVSKQALLFGVSGTVACYCLAVVEGAFGAMRLGPFEGVPRASNATSVTAVLFLPIYVGICEEMIFRGALQTRLERAIGPPAAIALTTVLFLAVHLQRPDFATQWMFLATLSIVLGVVVSKFDSLPLCVLLHASTNFVSVGLTWAFGPFSLSDLSSAALLVVACFGTACGVLALLSLRLGHWQVPVDRSDRL